MAAQNSRVPCCTIALRRYMLNRPAVPDTCPHVITQHALQFPDAARQHRQKFILDFIMTGKIQVTCNVMSDNSSTHEMPQQPCAPKAGSVYGTQNRLAVAFSHRSYHSCSFKSPRQLQLDRNVTFQSVTKLCLLQKSTPNLDGAFKFLNTSVGSAPWTAEVSKGIEESAGVGVVVTPEQIKETVAKHIDKVKSDMLEQRSATAHCLIRPHILGCCTLQHEH